MATVRHNNNGLRKLCDCGRRAWAKCSHPWHFNFKPRGGTAYRFSLDAEVGHQVKGKTEAEKIAGDFRTAINNGTFVRAADRRRLAAVTPQPDAGAVTLDSYAKTYMDRHAKVSGKKTWSNDEYMLARLREFVLPDGSRLGLKALAAITEDDLEAFHTHLRAIGRAASTRNQYVQLLKASFRWAAKKGYIGRSPISEDSSLKRTKIAQRARRLVPDVLDKDGKVKTPGEERRLLDKAHPRLQRLIVAALETGCRRGELLKLQWADVNLERREIHIRGRHAKDGEDRVLPISERLAGVLEMAKTDPAGKEYGPTAHPFGELGEVVASTKRAWLTACRKAGVVDLHFHDLRHEAGSRLLESGWQLHQVREMLGHANIGQTSTYLNAGRMGLQDAMRRLDSVRCNPVANEAETDLPNIRNEADAETPKHLVN